MRGRRNETERTSLGKNMYRRRKKPLVRRVLHIGSTHSSSNIEDGRPFSSFAMATSGKICEEIVKIRFKFTAVLWLGVILWMNHCVCFGDVVFLCVCLFKGATKQVSKR